MRYDSALLQYRLKKGRDEYEPIYYYSDIDLSQILARRECEFFVKDGKTYKQLSSSIEGHLFVIYVELYEDAPIEPKVLSNSGITLEIREFNSRQNHPLIKTEHFSDPLDVLSVIGSVYTYVDKKEWERDSAEIDEDRGVYVLYVTPTGFLLDS